MSTRKPMSIRPGGNISREKQEALDIVSQLDDFLGTNVHKARVDLDKRIWKGVKQLSADTRTDEDKAVTFRMLATEALLDLFEKYENGEGQYDFDIGVNGFKFEK